MSADRAARAETLLALHRAPEILVLANAWDVASARIFARLPACRALATTSAGIAAALGYPDGELVPPEEMLAVVARIAGSVELPVTADLEAGYGDAAAVAEAALEAGAVGLNLEDGTGEADGPLVEPERHAAAIRAVRAVADGAGIPLVINARVDVYIARAGEPEARFDEVLRRAAIYLDAGADCIFVPAVADTGTIGRLVTAIDAPLNILAGAGTPPIAELERLGVARVSVGSGPMRATLGLVERIAHELLEEGIYTAFTEQALPFTELEPLLG